MEKEGLMQSMGFLEEAGVFMSTFVTDRHPQIRKWMREQMPTVQHLFDVWHIAKGKIFLLHFHCLTALLQYSLEKTIRACL